MFAKKTNGKKHSFALAESFSKENSGGPKFDYTPIQFAIKENGVLVVLTTTEIVFIFLLVKQYLTTIQGVMIKHSPMDFDEGPLSMK